MGRWLAGCVVAAGVGFLAGQSSVSTEFARVSVVPIAPEQAVVEFLKIDGDELSITLRGKVRVVWGEHFLDASGTVPLGQVVTLEDLKYREFPFVGNANTMKFYPSDTQWARGTRVRDRRFFATKQAAIDAGFIPSKSVH